MIWEPFLLALVLGLVVSAGLYFAYLWPQIEPEEPEGPETQSTEPHSAAPSEQSPEIAAPPATSDAASPAP